MNDKLLKQDLAKIYTRINKELFDSGVNRIKVETRQSEIVILAEHKRAFFLQSLEKHGEKELVNEVEFRLGKLFRGKLAAALQDELQIPYETIFRDYRDNKALTYILLES